MNYGKNTATGSNKKKANARSTAALAKAKSGARGKTKKAIKK